MPVLTEAYAHAPTQAAEFSGPGKQAIVLFSPDWTDEVLAVLHQKPTGYEAAWRFEAERRAHVLEVAFDSGPTIMVALIDGVHNAVIARVAGGAALVLSPFPLYREPPDQEVEQLFSPDVSVVLPELPNPLDLK